MQTIFYTGEGEIVFT